MTKLCKTYEKLTTTLQVSYENVKFAASDVIRQTLCQRPSLVEYFELKTTDNQSDNFRRMLLTYHFPKKILGSRISLTYKTYKNITTNLGKILGKSYEVSKIVPQLETTQTADISRITRQMHIDKRKDIACCRDVTESAKILRIRCNSCAKSVGCGFAAR